MNSRLRDGHMNRYRIIDSAAARLHDAEVELSAGVEC